MTLNRIIGIFAAAVICFGTAGCSFSKKRTISGTNDLPENGIVSCATLDALKKENSVAIFRSVSNGIEYEWTLFGSDVVSKNDIDLSLEVTDVTEGEGISFHLNSDKDFGFSPMLSLKLKKKWNCRKADIYRKTGDELTPAGTASVTGSDAETFNFNPKETYGDYVILIRGIEETTAPTDAGKSPENDGISSHSCTVSIECSSIFGDLTALDEEKLDVLPADGIILAPAKVKFTEGETVCDVLARVCKEEKLHFETSKTPVYGGAYVEGIGNLYEQDCGALSGWVYSVNGWFPNYSCSKYELKDGDVVEWRYTCDLGKDVGCSGLNS